MYTKQTWASGDTITASKLNHIEDGIASARNTATVCVNFNGGGIAGSVACFVGYAQYTQNRYSIESPIAEHYASEYSARMYISVPLPPSSDSFKAYIFFNDYINSMAGYTVTGNISSTKVDANVRLSDSTWSSEPIYGFEVSGDGQIDVYYED